MKQQKRAKRVQANPRQVRETLMHAVFLFTACVSIIAVVLICIFMFANGIPTILEIGPAEFLFGTTWKPLNNLFGILPMIVGSLYVTAGAILIGVPIGILCAVYLARFCPKRVYRVLKPLIDLLAGIPSIVYGFFGLVVIVPLMQQLTGASGGKNILTASLMLGIMILPTIISVSESAIRAVPESYYEGALALGATHERSVFFAVLPAAKSGILAGVILGVGRAIGEATAVQDGRWEPAHPAHEPPERRADADLQHRRGDGLRGGPAPRGAHRNGSGAVRVHPPHQPFLFGHEKEGGLVHGSKRDQPRKPPRTAPGIPAQAAFPSAASCSDVLRRRNGARAHGACRPIF